MRKYLIGVGISLTGHTVNALGMNLQRYAHTIETETSLVKRPPWLLGIACLGLAEVFNFVALSFAPGSVCAPLGSFGVMIGAILGQFLFNEPLTKTAYIAIGFITYGTFLIVINGPSNSKELSVEEFLIIIRSPFRIGYFASIILAMIIFSTFDNSKLFPTLTAASISAGNSLTLMKVLAVFVKMSVTSSNQMASVIPYCVIGFVAFSVILQVKLLNKAMEKYPAYIVNSIYFVMLTTFVIINSTILFDEMLSLDLPDTLLFASGCVAIVAGVILISLEKGDDVVEEEIPFIEKPQSRKNSIIL